MHATPAYASATSSGGAAVVPWDLSPARLRSPLCRSEEEAPLCAARLGDSPERPHRRGAGLWTIGLWPSGHNRDRRDRRQWRRWEWRLGQSLLPTLPAFDGYFADSAGLSPAVLVNDSVNEQVFFIGDDFSRTEFESILSFDLMAVPPGVLIVAAETLFKSTLDDPFISSSEGIDVNVAHDDLGSSLDLSDRLAGGSGTHAGDLSQKNWSIPVIDWVAEDVAANRLRTSFRIFAWDVTLIEGFARYRRPINGRLLKSPFGEAASDDALSPRGSIRRAAA